MALLVLVLVDRMSSTKRLKTVPNKASDRERRTRDNNPSGDDDAYFCYYEYSIRTATANTYPRVTSTRNLPTAIVCYSCSRCISQYTRDTGVLIIQLYY